MKHLMREKLARAPQRFRDDLCRRQFLQFKRHITAFIEHLQQLQHVGFAARFIQSHADRTLVEHAQVDPVCLCNTREVGCALGRMLHSQRVEK